MSKPAQPADSLAPEILAYYEAGDEAQRLFTGAGRLELARTQELVARYLPRPPAAVLDVGGGSGVYACWLAELGYEVHLVDAVPSLVEQARRASRAQPGYPLARAEIGDARKLTCPDSSVDGILLLGPLYHLTHRDERLAALREAHRSLRTGGVLLAAAISRFASALDGLSRGLFDDPEFVRIAKWDLADGQHRNPTNRPGYFTTAFFHRPEELQAEVEAAGLHHEATLAIEGPGWMATDFEAQWHDQGRRERLLSAIRWLESEPSLLGVSAHLLVVARKS